MRSEHPMPHRPGQSEDPLPEPSAPVQDPDPGQTPDTPPPENSDSPAQPFRARERRQTGFGRTPKARAAGRKPRGAEASPPSPDKLLARSA